jgi:hypothetical protein
MPGGFEVIEIASPVPLAGRDEIIDIAFTKA